MSERQPGPESATERGMGLLGPLLLAASLVMPDSVAARTRVFEYTNVPAACGQGATDRCRMDLQSQFKAIQKELGALKGQSFQEHGITLLNTEEGIGDLCQAALPLLAQHRDKVENVWRYMKSSFARWDDTLRAEILEATRNGKTLKGKNATDAQVFALIDSNIAAGKQALEICQHTPDAVVGIAKFFSKKARTADQKLRDTQRKAPDTISSIIKLFAEDPNIHKEPAARDALAILKALAPKSR